MFAPPSPFFKTAAKGKKAAVVVEEAAPAPAAKKATRGKKAAPVVEEEEVAEEVLPLNPKPLTGSGRRQATARSRRSCKVTPRTRRAACEALGQLGQDEPASG